MLEQLRRFEMPKALVLLNVESGSEDEVLKELSIRLNRENQS
jgi:hypothetical protein